MLDTDEQLAATPIQPKRGAYSTIALIVLNTLIALLVVEGCSALVLSLRGDSQPPLAQRIEAFIEQQVALGYYRQQDWGRPYWEEHMQVADNWDYQPYTLWRTRPHSGEYINIDENGVRHTPGSTCTDDSYRIFVFGGSTLWGYGSPDWGTIPAYLQAGLAEQGVICVTNYADVGFNSTQSVIRLLELLQAGAVPDMVIFYDGANEVTTANVSGQAGGHFYIELFDAAIDGTIVNSRVDEAPDFGDVLRQTATFRLMIGEVPRPARPYVPYSDELADAVTQTYLANYTTVSGMAEAYGFTFIAFWQPVLPVRTGEPNDEEQRFLWDMPGGLPELFTGVYARVRQAAPDYAHLYDISDVLDAARDGAIWVDFNHLTPVGNQIVAQAMIPIINTYLEAVNSSN